MENMLLINFGQNPGVKNLILPLAFTNLWGHLQNFLSFQYLVNPFCPSSHYIHIAVQVCHPQHGCEAYYTITARVWRLLDHNSKWLLCWTCSQGTIASKIRLTRAILESCSEYPKSLHCRPGWLRLAGGTGLVSQSLCYPSQQMEGIYLLLIFKVIFLTCLECVCQS